MVLLATVAHNHKIMGGRAKERVGCIGDYQLLFFQGRQVSTRCSLVQDGLGYG